MLQPTWKLMKFGPHSRIQKYRYIIKFIEGLTNRQTDCDRAMGTHKKIFHLKGWRCAKDWFREVVVQPLQKNHEHVWGAHTPWTRLGCSYSSLMLMLIISEKQCKTGWMIKINKRSVKNIEMRMRVLLKTLYACVVYKYHNNSLDHHFTIFRFLSTRRLFYLTNNRQLWLCTNYSCFNISHKI